MSISDGYSEWSISYDCDENLTRDLDAVITRNCLSDKRFSNILEIGCGTGKNTPFLATIANHVLGIDFSPGMLDQARKKITQTNVAFVQSDLNERWPVADHSVDLIVGNLVLEHIEDLPSIFQQAQRCLSEHGLFFVSELHPVRQYLGSQARFQHGDQITRIAAFQHHLTDFLSAAHMAGLKLVRLNEWWHERDENQIPRLVSFLWANKE